MSSITALPTLKGKISSTTKNMAGRLSAIGHLTGHLSVVREREVYTGDYTVTPRAFVSQTLDTADRVMSGNVTVTEVPYYETDNDSGTTAYIAKEV